MLYLVPSNDYLLLPDRAHPVAPLVEVKGGKDPTGPGRHLLRRRLRAAREHVRVALPVDPRRRDARAREAIVPPGVSDKAVRQADLREMSISQRVAAAVALKRLGYKVVARPSGVIVAALDSRSHAVGKLRPAT